MTLMYSIQKLTPLQGILIEAKEVAKEIFINPDITITRIKIFLSEIIHTMISKEENMLLIVK